VNREATAASLPSYRALANCVLTTAGATAFTRIAGATSTASCSVRYFSAALLMP